MNPSEKATGDRDDPIRVLVIDDHEAVRSGLASIFGITSDIEMVGEAQNGNEGIKLASTLVPDIILMDVNMPDTDGISATRSIIAKSPQIRIIGFSMNDSQTVAKAMLAAGASDYVNKAEKTEVLLEAIRKDHGKMKGREEKALESSEKYIGV